MTPLRVAQICADRGIRPGGTKGASQHLRGIAEGLTACGHHVRTFAAREPDGSFPVEIVPLTELGSATDVDVVYERYSLGHRDGLEHARALGVPFVLEVNSPLVDEALAHRPDSVSPDDRNAEHELLASADLVIAVSSELAAWIRQHRSGPVLVQPNGFEPTWFATCGPRSAAHEAPFPLVFLGHPKPWHGADRIVPLLVELRRTGHRPRTIMIGGGPGSDHIRAAADRHGLADQLTITGALPPHEASGLLADSIIGLAPYPHQSPFYFCPLKIVDYLAAGLAIVSTRQGDIATLVGDAGVVLDDPDDDNAIADAVRQLLDDDDRRIAMGLSGRRRAHESMTWRHVAANTADAIARLVAAPTVGARP